MTSAYVQMAQFITLGYVKLSIAFPTWLIGNQAVIEKLEQNKAESQKKIETVSFLGVAPRHHS